jgi:ubiquitin carboxyl-terminal hydrolase 10
VGQHDANVEQASQEPTPATQSEPSTQAPKQEEESSSVSDYAETTKLSDTEVVTKASTTTDVPVPRPAAPAIPVVPVLPKHGPKLDTTDQEKVNGDAAKSNDQDTAAAVSDEVQADGTNGSPSPVVRAPPTSWANLFAKPSARAPINGSGLNGVDADNGDSTDATNTFPGSTFSKSNTNSLAEAIQSYLVENNGKLDFLEPRGLINTGNMCYMNSVSLHRELF